MFYPSVFCCTVVVSCTGPLGGGSCTTDNNVQLSCTATDFSLHILACTHTETHTVPGTGITQSGGVSGG
jgi:hypothetical protein